MATMSETSKAITKIPAALSWCEQTPFYQAGLAGYSDRAMRMVARRHGCPFCITEAMLDTILVHGGKGLRHAEIESDDHPIAGQLMGSEPGMLAEASKIIADMGYDIVDLNLACPVKKVRKKARGGHLLSEPDTAIAILEAVREAVGDVLPLTVKMRRSFDDTPEMVENFYRILDRVFQLGYASATVHGRTVEQKYLGPSRWPDLKRIVEAFPDQLIFGSGDIFSPESIFQMIEQTGVKAVSVARGCIGNPWIFEQAHQLMRGEQPTPPTVAQQRRVLAEHFELSVALNGEDRAGRMMRKFGIKFSIHHPASEAVKDAFIRVRSLADWQTVLDRFYTDAWESVPRSTLINPTHFADDNDSCEPDEIPTTSA